MRTIPSSSILTDEPLRQEVAKVLSDGGLVCIPCSGRYRLICDLWNPDAIQDLMVAKHRTKNKPSLVFVPNRAVLNQVTENLPADLGRIADAFWPGPVTVLVECHPDLDRATRKALTAANKHLGVRVPADDAARLVVEAFGGPVLASSANRERKGGADSGSHVRRSFSRIVDVFIDAGELRGGQPSTVVQVKEGDFSVLRAGAVSSEAIAAAL